MSNSENRAVSRRVVLGGAAALVGAQLVHAPVAFADDSVDAIASRLDSDWIKLRRDIHRHPEVAGQEKRTAGLVAQRLRKAGLDVTTGVGGYGVVGILKGATAGPGSCSPPTPNSAWPAASPSTSAAPGRNP